MKSTNSKSKISRILFASIFAGLVLQACNASLAKSKPNVQASDKNKVSSMNNTMNKEKLLKLFHSGLNIKLHDLVQGYSTVLTKDNKLLNKPLHVVSGNFLQKIILNSSRKKEIKSCQFIAMRIELNGNLETAEWLVTTKGKGKCNPEKDDAPRNFWVIQKYKNQSGRVLHEGRAYRLQITGAPDSTKILWADIYTNNSSRIKNIEITCKEQYEIEGNRYKKINEEIQAYKPTGSMLNSHTPEMFWEDVTGDSSYQCRS